MSRRRFQIHFSTAIIMMFVAAALLWGFFVIRAAAIAERQASPYHDNSGEMLMWTGLYVFASPVILILTGFGCEHVIRRRESPRP
jgi:hypothetical protein